MGIEDYKFGKTYKEKISKEDALKFATLFGEGSPSLTKLIEYCILNEISTISSCKGHPEKYGVIDRLSEKGYITFNFDMNYESSDLAYYLATIPLYKKGIVASLSSNVESDRTVTLRVPASSKGMSEEYFTFILECLKKYKAMKESNQSFECSEDIKKIVDYIFYSYNSNEIFDISKAGYKKLKRDGMYYRRVSKCPSKENTSELHQKIGKLFSKQADVDSFIEATRKR